MADRRILGFPATVNEVAARLVAGGVVAQGIAFLVIRQWWVLVPLTYGFLARVLTGPTLSPLGQLVTRVVVPRLPVAVRPVPGPPKRFAQAMGLTFTAAASLSWALGVHPLAIVLISGLVGAASLEAFAGLCIGCMVFARLMRWGVIPADVCEECNDISARLARAA